MSGVGGISGGGYGPSALQAQLQQSRQNTVVKNEGDGDGARSVNEFQVLAGEKTLARPVSEFETAADGDLAKSGKGEANGKVLGHKRASTSPPQPFSRQTFKALLQAQESAGEEKNQQVGLPAGVEPTDVTSEAGASGNPNDHNAANIQSGEQNPVNDIKNLVKDIIGGSSSAGTGGLASAA